MCAAAGSAPATCPCSAGLARRCAGSRTAPGTAGTSGPCSGSSTGPPAGTFAGICATAGSSPALRGGGTGIKRLRKWTSSSAAHRGAWLHTAAGRPAVSGCTLAEGLKTFFTCLPVRTEPPLIRPVHPSLLNCRVELALSIGETAASSSAETAAMEAPQPAPLQQQPQQPSPAPAAGSPQRSPQRRPSPAKTSGLGGSPQKGDFVALAEYSRLVEGSTALADTIPVFCAGSLPHAAPPACATPPPTHAAVSDLS